MLTITGTPCTKRTIQAGRAISLAAVTRSEKGRTRSKPVVARGRRDTRKDVQKSNSRMAQDIVARLIMRTNLTPISDCNNLSSQCWRGAGYGARTRGREREATVCYMAQLLPAGAGPECRRRRCLIYAIGAAENNDPQSGLKAAGNYMRARHETSWPRVSCRASSVASSPVFSGSRVPPWANEGVAAGISRTRTRNAGSFRWLGVKITLALLPTFFLPQRSYLQPRGLDYD